LIKNGDRSKLIESIENLISDIELREKFSKNALKITEKLDQDNIIEEWQSLIGEVIEKYGD
jgi:glycosyltransferase involved in cell wall biosynthesis